MVDLDEFEKELARYMATGPAEARDKFAEDIMALVDEVRKARKVNLNLYLGDSIKAGIGGGLIMDDALPKDTALTWALTDMPLKVLRSRAEEMKVCPTCGGDGGDLDDSSKPCDECDGFGRVPA